MSQTLTDLKKLLDGRLQTLEVKIKFLHLTTNQIDAELDEINQLKKT